MSDFFQNRSVLITLKKKLTTAAFWLSWDSCDLKTAFKLYINSVADTCKKNTAVHPSTKKCTWSFSSLLQHVRIQSDSANTRLRVFIIFYISAIGISLYVGKRLFFYGDFFVCSAGGYLWKYLDFI